MIFDGKRLTIIAAQFGLDPEALADAVEETHISGESSQVWERLLAWGFTPLRGQEVLSDVAGMTEEEVAAAFKKCREPVIGRICQWLEAEIPEYIILSRVHDAYLESNIMMSGCDRKLSYANELRLAAIMIAKGEGHAERAKHLIREAFDGKVRQIEIFIPSGMNREAILRDLREALEILTNPELSEMRDEALSKPFDLPDHFALRIWNALR